MSGNTGWYEKGVYPTEGERYEFEDFIGARFTGTFDHFETHRTKPLLTGGTMLEHLDPHDAKAVLYITLYFTDHPSFTTNMPVRFRDAERLHTTADAVSETEPVAGGEGTDA